MGFLSHGRVWTLALLTAAIAFACNAGVAAAAFPGQNGLIAYEDGGTIATTSPALLGAGSDPSWSSDGQEIGFVNASGDIAVMNHDGTNAHSLGVAGSSPSWSPDLDHIVFQQGTSIMEVSTFTGALSTLLAGVPGAHDYSQPAFSPDGSQVAVTDTIPTTPRQSTIDVFPAAGGAPLPVTSVTTAGQLDSAADWSPDGSTLVYSHQTPAGVVLEEVPSGGGIPTVIPNNGDSWSDPGFSPDGTELVATSHLTSVDIWTLSASGPVSQLTNIDGAGHADWGVKAASVNTPVWQTGSVVYAPDPSGTKAPSCASITALSAASSCVAVIFDRVLVAGNTTMTPSATGPSAPGFSVGGTYYDLHTTAKFTTARVCVYDTSTTASSVLLHYDSSGTATDVTDHNFPAPPNPDPGVRVCSVPLTSLSPFAIAQPAATDTTPPAISLSHSTDGQSRWNVTAPVTVAVNATDPDGGLARPPICTDTANGGASASLTVSGSEPNFTVSIGGEGVHQINCTATDPPGNSAGASDTVKIDTQPPVVSYSGNAGSYTVDQTVNITCTASDPSPGSGVASSTCATVGGPAYAFAVGSNTFSADATDKAGNKGHGSVTFTVQVTASSLCQVTKQFVESSSKWAALPPWLQSAIDPRVSQLCTALSSANFTNPSLKAAAIAAYDRGVQFLAASGWLTSDQASTLNRLAGGL